MTIISSIENFDEKMNTYHPLLGTSIDKVV
jgi:hypothetical protein